MANQIINENTILANIDSTPYLKFNAFDKFNFIKHGFSTKLGGVSEGIFESMNLGFRRGDEEENVRKNFGLICKSIGIKEDDLVFTDQVHKANIRVVTSEDKGKGYNIPRDYSEIDGHITKEANVPLLVFAADCTPIYYVDPVKKAIGLTHSGWRGTAIKIGKKTVEEMQRAFGTNPSDITAVIGPCICKQCYEVSKDVAEAFAENFTESDLLRILEKKPKDKYQLDLWEANRLILLEAGLLEENIVVSGVCTMCNQDLLFSHRGSAGKRGSLAGFLEISE